MANNRTAIRNAVQSLLLSHTSAGLNVFTNHTSKLWLSELPAILISTSHEPIIPESMQSKRYLRTLQLSIKVKVVSSETVDDDLDALVGQIETIMAANPGLSGTVLGTIQTQTEIITDGGGESDLATATLTFESKYIS